MASDLKYQVYYACAHTGPFMDSTNIVYDENVWRKILPMYNGWSIREAYRNARTIAKDGMFLGLIKYTNHGKTGVVDTINADDVARRDGPAVADNTVITVGSDTSGPSEPANEFDRTAKILSGFTAALDNDWQDDCSLTAELDSEGRIERITLVL